MPHLPHRHHRAAKEGGGGGGREKSSEKDGEDQTDRQSQSRKSGREPSTSSKRRSRQRQEVVEEERAPELVENDERGEEVQRSPSPRRSLRSREKDVEVLEVLEQFDDFQERERSIRDPTPERISNKSKSKQVGREDDVQSYRSGRKSMRSRERDGIVDGIGDGIADGIVDEVVEAEEYQERISNRDQERISNRDPERISNRDQGERISRSKSAERRERGEDVQSYRSARKSMRTRDKDSIGGVEDLIIEEYQELNRDQERISNRDQERISNRDPERISNRDQERISSRDPERISNRNPERMSNRGQEERISKGKSIRGEEDRQSYRSARRSLRSRDKEVVGIVEVDDVVEEYQERISNRDQGERISRSKSEPPPLNRRASSKLGANFEFPKNEWEEPPPTFRRSQEDAKSSRKSRNQVNQEEEQPERRSERRSQAYAYEDEVEVGSYRPPEEDRFDDDYQLKGSKKVSYAAEGYAEDVRSRAQEEARSRIQEDARSRTQSIRLKEYYEIDENDLPADLDPYPNMRPSSTNLPPGPLNPPPLLVKSVESQRSFMQPPMDGEAKMNNNFQAGFQQFSQDSMLSGGNGRSPSFQKDVQPLPIEMPGDIADAQAFKRYLSNQASPSYESLGGGGRRSRAQVGLTSRAQIGNEASRRTASLSHAIMTLALLSASICQLRFLITYSHSHSYPVLNYFLIFTSIILEIAAGIGYVLISRCSYDEEKSETIHNYLIFALFIVAVCNVILAAFAFDGHICDGHHLTPNQNNSPFIPPYQETPDQQLHQQANPSQPQTNTGPGGADTVGSSSSVDE